MSHTGPAQDREADETAAIDIVAKFFGIERSASDQPKLYDALATALVHDSYLYERPDACAGATPGVLRGLDAFGTMWLGRELAIRLYMSRDFATVGQLAGVHAAAVTAFGEWLETLNWLVDCPRYGKGEAPRGPSSQTRRKIMSQVIGALALAGAGLRLRYGLEPVFAKAINLADLGPQDLDPLSYLESKSSAYSLTWEYTRSGPDHAPSFTAIVTAKDKRRGEGTGGSKKLARVAAARAFISDHLRAGCDEASRHAPTRPLAQPSALKMPDTSRRAVDGICHDFGLAPRWKPLITQALVHSSWVYEHRAEVAAAKQRDNSLLAFVGSWVADCEYMRSLAIGACRDKPQKLSALTLPDEELAAHASQLGFDAAMLLGVGEGKSRGTRVSLSSNAIQAVLGAIYIALGTPPTITDAMPGRWSDLKDTLTPSRPRAQDSKSVLLEICAACDLKVSYTWTAEGPDHEKRFYATVTMESAILRESVMLRGPWASSRKAADQQCAQRIVQVLMGFGDRITTQPPPQIRGSVFVLRHLVAVAQTRPAVARRWDPLGLLGSSIVNVRELLQWAVAVDRFITTHAINRVEVARLSEFYRHSAVQQAHMRAATTALTTTAQHLAHLDEPAAITSELEDRLVALSAVYRAAGESTSNTRCSFTDLVSDWKLLYRNDITVSGEIPELEIAPDERSMLDTLIGRMLDRRGAVHVEINGPSMRAIPDSGDPDAAMPELVELFADLTISVEVYMQATALHVRLLKAVRDDDGPVVTAVKGALTAEPSSLYSSIANALHDMKNQIAAARQSGNIPAGLSRTDRLHRELIASQHLDRAKLLATQLQAAGSLATASTGTTELSAYLRSYGADLLRRLPAKLRIAVNSPATPVTVELDNAHLAAILDNLVKNALEALPDGGTVDLSATGDTVDAYIEVSDDGPGVPGHIIDAVSAGRAIQSTKLNGNGLGLLGIRNLVCRVGGSLTYISDHPGACWRITLPLAHDVVTKVNET